WHQLKLVGGMLLPAVPFGPRSIAAQLQAMPSTQVAQILDNAQALAQDVDQLKQRGLYADIDAAGCRLTEPPSEVLELGRAIVSAFDEAGYGRTPGGTRRSQSDRAAAGAASIQGSCWSRRQRPRCCSARSPTTGSYFAAG